MNPRQDFRQGVYIGKLFEIFFEMVQAHKLRPQSLCAVQHQVKVRGHVQEQK